MFERNITTDDAEDVIEYGEKIEENLKAKPLPKYLMFKFIATRPLHVSIGVDIPVNICRIITLYEPSLAIFEMDYKTRKKSKS